VPKDDLDLLVVARPPVLEVTVVGRAYVHRTDEEAYLHLDQLRVHAAALGLQLSEVACTRAGDQRRRRSFATRPVRLWEVEELLGQRPGATLQDVGELLYLDRQTAQRGPSAVRNAVGKAKTALWRLEQEGRARHTYDADGTRRHYLP
jgi:hypothetical protein